jgi:hypothetical protein
MTSRHAHGGRRHGAPQAPHANPKPRALAKACAPADPNISKSNKNADGLYCALQPLRKFNPYREQPLRLLKNFAGGTARLTTKDTRTMSLKSVGTALSMSITVPALAAFLGAGSAAAADQSLASHHIRHVQYRHPGVIAPGLYDYAPVHGPTPCYLHINCGLPGGHPRSDYHKVGNGDHGNDGGNGG